MLFTAFSLSLLCDSPFDRPNARQRPFRARVCPLSSHFPFPPFSSLRHPLLPPMRQTSLLLPPSPPAQSQSPCFHFPSSGFFGVSNIRTRATDGVATTV